MKVFVLFHLSHYWTLLFLKEPSSGVTKGVSPGMLKGGDRGGDDGEVFLGAGARAA